MSRTLLYTVALILLSGIGYAAEDVSVKSIVESQKFSEQVASQAPGSPGHKPDDRSTPRISMINLTRYLDDGDLSKASEFLDMRFLPAGMESADAGQLITRLAYVFRRHIWVDIASVSDSPDGYLEDGLPRYRDSLGEVSSSSGKVPILLQRVPNGQGGFEWKISNKTVAAIDDLWKEFGRTPFQDNLAKKLPPFDWLGLENWQWLYLLAFILALVAAVAVLHKLLTMKSIEQRSYLHERLIWFLYSPLAMFAYIELLRGFMATLGLSVTARAIFDSVLLDYTAWSFLAVGMIDFLAERTRRAWVARGSAEMTVIIQPVSIVIKIFTVAVLVVAGFSEAGFEVTTIIAGLGVGSLAVALAAQRTLENLIGAITLYIAQPVRPGDFCRFGDIVGTVEAIGLRSTEVRTLDRTLVHIPNSIFISKEVENYSRRDMIRLHRMLALRLDTSPDQLRLVTARLRELLYSHPMIDRSTVSVRLFNSTDYAWVLRWDSRVKTTDFQQYLAVAEDVYLRLMDIVLEAGASFATPADLRVADASYQDATRRGDAEQLIAQWREQDRLPFPDWPDDYIEKLEGTLDYPPGGPGPGGR
jgi:MscS family membrane protein